MTRTITGASVKLPRPRPACECGQERPPGRRRCDQCQQQQDVAVEARRRDIAARMEQLAEQRRRLAAEAEIRNARIENLLRQGMTHRRIAAQVGTSIRTVCRVGQRDPLTGKMPR